MSKMTFDNTRAFSLVEMLVVIAIMILLAGMIVGTYQTEERHASVRQAAERLASTISACRARAIREQIGIGISFNITNGKDTS
ncbi:MAG: prepilin-type N-terminal cleavage/methylation domain-containing protein, partial [Chloroflexota bacterium]|nr:prepilin-type N-terminal cleavage/methylation domain-containing protein [Chloroflexota bacterium]